MFQKDAGRHTNMRLYSLGYNEKLIKKQTRLLEKNRSYCHNYRVDQSSESEEDSDKS